MKKIILSIFLFILIFNSVKSQVKTPDNLEKKWWKEAVVYQIYPRSFKDSNGDGIGDLKGIISKLDYLKSTGITAIWLNPIYESPNDDNGYDISNYREIMRDFGTMKDFDALLTGMHERGIKLIMDLVVNHSSDENEWFQESRKSRTNKYRNYYYWWPAEKGTPPYRWSFFDVNSNAWKYDKQTDSYYLHYFSQKQPDLNWNNPTLRQEIYSMMKFWLDKGIDGFRMDAFQFISKDDSFPELPKETTSDPQKMIKYYMHGSHLHDYIQEMNSEVLSKYPNAMTVAEGAGDSPQEAMNFVDPARKELNIAYHFESVDIGDKISDYSLVKYKKMFVDYDTEFKDKGWLAIFLANHDNPRMVNKFGSDTPEFREISSKMLSTFILTMRGTPFYYNGDELGMDNIKFDDIKDYNDVDTKNKYQHLKETGGNLKAFLEGQKQTSRENSRTPFQWNDAAHAGFTTGKPWLKINPNYKKINQESEEKDPNSVLNYFRQLTKLRKENPILVYGKFELIDKKNPAVFAYTRESNGEKWLIILNFTDKNTALKSDFNLKKAKLVLSNYKDLSQDLNLKPYESVIYQIK